MKRNVTIFVSLVSFIILCTACKREYIPPAINMAPQFLVVDGTAIANGDSASVFTISRTIKLTDTTFSSSYETNAVVKIESASGQSFEFTENTPGHYRSLPLLLNVSDEYRLAITTAKGDSYFSDFMHAVQTPPIDSVTWRQQNAVMIYVNTHDPFNNTHYYKWDFEETWQYNAKYNRTIAQQNGRIYYVDSSTQTYNCWSADHSSSVLTGSSVALAQDVISDAQLTTIAAGSVKLGVRYSILVKQFGISKEEYNYLQVLKKNTEELGSLFDAQPTQLIGNIHAANNPDEVVIGYFGISALQQYRLFINANELNGWTVADAGPSCDIVSIPQNGNDYLIYDYADNAYEPYYFSSMPNLIALARTYCVDCTARGGTTKKPAFW